MDSYRLPATTYEAPARQVRKHILNTIIEDEHSEHEQAKLGSGCDQSSQRGRKRISSSTRSIESSSPVPSLTSSASSCYKTRRASCDFDDLYDISDDDSDQDHDITPGMFPSVGIVRSVSPTSSTHSMVDPKKIPSLIIPSPDHWPTVQRLKDCSPPLPPKVPLSPAVLSLLPRDRPAPICPPSLDSGSISEPLASSTNPSTPDTQVNPKGEDVWGQMSQKKPAYNAPKVVHLERSTAADARLDDDLAARWYTDDNIVCADDTIMRSLGFGNMPDSPVLGSDSGCSDSGVQLPPQALATLQHLSLEIPINTSTVEVEEGKPACEMQEVVVPSSRSNSVDFTPVSHTSECSISNLSIPSPGGFFSSLDTNARHAWCFNGAAATAPCVVPPSSTTAENFYNCPWNRDPCATVERVVECDDNDTEGPPTARQLPIKTVVEEQNQSYFEGSPHLEGVLEIGKDYDEDYENAIRMGAESSLDRTSLWLADQTSYMAALRETNPINDIGTPSKRPSIHGRHDTLGSPLKKAVRFMETEVAPCKSSRTTQMKSDSTFYHAFQHIMRAQTRQDAFRHRRTRSDSLQAERITMPDAHIERLNGDYHITVANRPNPLRPISMFPGKDQDADEQTVEQKVIAQVEKERQALEQANATMWVVEAYKYLNGGSLLHSPATSKLKCSAIHVRDKVSPPDVVRVLDLGGQPNCDWAWHCAREYTNVKVYTATTEHEAVHLPIRGPSNHRRAAVGKLWELPYPDNYFEAVSARSLFSFLKTEKPLDEVMDEYDLCLRECLRCLKPGGYLEFMLLDSEIVNAGARGTAVSVEFGFSLKTRGYDPSPTKSWLGRVRRAGLDDIKRAWTFLPMGTPQTEANIPPETPPPDVSTCTGAKMEVEAVQGPVGSTADAASMSGLVGSWAWEQWMLRLQTEMGKENALDG
ncbi:MAG: hypothetical protein Q9191_004141, partial [Dirinaria sp. TL-2023a]